MKKSYAVLLILLICVSIGWADTIHVPGDYPTIQQGINNANHGDSVVVAPGVYQENIDFLGKNIVIFGEAGPEFTIVDGGGINSVVSFSSGETNLAKLTGFTIQNGSASDGGGIYISGSSPTIERNLVTENEASNGGGIYIGSFSSPDVINNTILLNSAGWWGGGIYHSISGNAVIKNNIIAWNLGDSGFYTLKTFYHGNTYNCYWENTGGDLGGFATQGEGEFGANPEFINFSGGDFHLTEGSPCIDAGDPNTPVPPGGGDRVDVGAFEFLSGYPVVVTISSDATVVHPGENLWFTVSVENVSDESQTFDAWLDVYLINGNPYPQNPVRGPVALTLGPFYEIEVHLFIFIPNFAPLGGPYTLYARAGDYPEVWDEDFFEFDVLP